MTLTASSRSSSQFVAGTRPPWTGFCLQRVVHPTATPRASSSSRRATRATSMNSTSSLAPSGRNESDGSPRSPSRTMRVRTQARALHLPRRFDHLSAADIFVPFRSSAFSLRRACRENASARRSSTPFHVRERECVCGAAKCSASPIGRARRVKQSCWFFS